jgi:hypothetical protein
VKREGALGRCILPDPGLEKPGPALGSARLAVKLGRMTGEL